MGAAELLDGKIVIGHSVQNDFQALMLTHPHAFVRDTALFRPLRPPGQQRTPSLAKLAEHWLHETIHSGKHDSVEDARIALRLYKLKSRLWEKQLRSAMKPSQNSIAENTSITRRGDEEDLGERVDADNDDDGAP